MKEYRNSLLNVLCKTYPSLTREELRVLILTGRIYVNSHKERNPKVLLLRNSKIDLVEDKSRQFVSRGGFKLFESLETFKITVKDKICIDVGASTGGFTDCLLQKGAKLVYAVDVGFNQLSYKLRVDPRVRVFEKTNIFDIKQFDMQPNLAVIDVSFRSVVSICTNLIDKLSDKLIVALVKPQFELKGLHLDIKEFNGIVENRYLSEILEKVIRKFYDNNLQIKNILKLTTKGRKGNQEFMFLVVKDSSINLAQSLALIGDINF
ncbi:23S rRNA (cytidine(1920)-2'-O)-methyltransferase [Borrelia nietonii YOR]|uniref:23S rRNA (Cytidine(1920)-2'-O)-methyltransferase n=1 Tax=Borrelia nietonii YOR TaxID=1293576 RepID=A0ABM5PIJ8_9SPIR|nr:MULTISPECIES: TlyA family RNA methyltransferase [Borrelia]AHH03501.1 23S rRNA (cytidine(1920)-2'-O)-methyltransferase [Borrelia nietonii YOR]AHH14009.1 23S rRNA (cytidine(1920)-2'-O)-methyltransferase [Borrelia hermsii MTW]UPA09209.1 TlyA family RNA methyltransferase [Borrelia nietonii YOR]